MKHTLPRWSIILNRAAGWWLFLVLLPAALVACVIILRAPRVLLDPDAGTALLALVGGVVGLGVWLLRRSR